MRWTPLRLAFFVPALGAWACQDLPSIPRQVCGNGIIEPERGEDCDLTADEPQRCGGADEGALACRFVADAAHECPVGYKAGADLVCRLPAGAFSDAPGGPLASPLSWHALADMNDDGLPDLVGLSESRDAFAIHWGDGTGLFSARFDLSTGQTVAPPALGPLVGDASSDAIMPLANGLIVLRGSEARTVQPAAYSTLAVEGRIERSLIVPINISPTHSVPIILADVPGRGVEANAVAVTPSQIILGDRVPITRKAAVSALAGRPARENLDPQEAGPEAAQELGFGFVGLPQVWLIGVSQGPADDPLRPSTVEIRQVVELPFPLAGQGAGVGALKAGTFAPERVRDADSPSAIFLADLNHDGRRDLLAIVEADGEVAAVVALALPDGQMGEATLDAPRTAALRREGQVECPGADGPIQTSAPRMPLALADFDEEGEPDLVMPWGVILNPSRMGERARCAWLPGGPLGSAAVGDFNRDLHLDLATASTSSSGLVFGFGDGRGGFNSASVAGVNVADRLRVGDFDGDFVDDVAYVETPTEGLLAPGTEAEAVATQSVLQVVFGRPDGRVDLPENRIETGRFNPLQCIETYREDRLRADVTDDLMLLVAAPVGSQGASRSIASLVGTPQRLMLSPLVLQRPGDVQPRLDAPVRVAEGRFRGPDAAIDLATIARPPGERGAGGVALAEDEPVALLYEMESQTGSALRPTDAKVFELDCPANFSWENAVLQVADLDLDGRLELVAIDERVPIEAFFFGHADPPAPVENDGHVQVIVLRREKDLWRCEADELPDLEAGISAFALGDWNADGKLDLALAHSGPVTQSLAKGEMSGRVTLYAGDGDGFALDDGVDLVLPAPTRGLEAEVIDDGTFPLDLAAIDADGDAAPELLISLFGRGLFLANPTTEAAAPQTAPIALVEEPGFTAWLAVGDLNADGLDDIVLRGLSRASALLGVDTTQAVSP